jgi:hypothetical protein
MGMLVTRGECQRSERRADLLLFARMWLSLTEPIKDDLQGAYELPSQRPIGLTQRHFPLAIAGSPPIATKRTRLQQVRAPFRGRSGEPDGSVMLLGMAVR